MIEMAPDTAMRCKERGRMHRYRSKARLDLAADGIRSAQRSSMRPTSFRPPGPNTIRILCTIRLQSHRLNCRARICRDERYGLPTFSKFGYGSADNSVWRMFSKTSLDAGDCLPMPVPGGIRPAHQPGLPQSRPLR